MKRIKFPLYIKLMPPIAKFLQFTGIITIDTYWDKFVPFHYKLVKAITSKQSVGQ